MRDAIGFYIGLVGGIIFVILLVSALKYFIGLFEMIDPGTARLFGGAFVLGVIACVVCRR